MLTPIALRMLNLHELLVGSSYLILKSREASTFCNDDAILQSTFGTSTTATSIFCQLDKKEIADETN